MPKLTDPQGTAARAPHTHIGTACVVCGLEGDGCGPMQRTDCCDQPFHWNASCARTLGIRVRRGGPTGDLRCAPQCAPCEPEDTGDDWQRRLLLEWEPTTA